VSVDRRIPLKQPIQKLNPEGDLDVRGHRDLSLFEQLGGEQKLRAIIETFIDRVFDDRIIGFFFRRSSREHLKKMEYQLAASFLGAPVEYEGRQLDEVHAKHPIMGGHFARRRQILKEALDFHQVPEPIKEAWLTHTDELRPLITAEQGSDCDSNSARQRAGSS
jgi:hemoglobin